MVQKAQAILRRAFAHIPNHGFTRRAIAASAPATGTPLSETAISALFGAGDNADRTLIRAWLEEGRAQMNPAASQNGQSSSSAGSTPSPTMEEVLLRRLKWNEPVLHHLKDAFALLAVPSVPFIPVLDIRPAIQHAFEVADEACYIVPPPSNGIQNWHARRVGIAGVYAAAELHQLASPSTAPDFLSRILEASFVPSQAAHELGLFADFGARGWAGILKGRGLP